MKKQILFSLVIFVFGSLNAQTYFPFPTDSAEWNCLNIAQNEPNYIYYTNYKYNMEGDTVIQDISYKKVYSTRTDQSTEKVYLGGLREDDSKTIFFFPVAQDLPNMTNGGVSFPNDTSEHLLYSFNDIAIDSVLPIYSGYSSSGPKVINIDSVLVGEDYRVRYEIMQSNIFDLNYWIEGIGSTHDLFAPYGDEFEWHNTVLCFTDSITYSSLDGSGNEGECTYDVSFNVENRTNDDIFIYPNPSKGLFHINSDDIKAVEVLDITGEIVFLLKEEKNIVNVNLTDHAHGIYFVKVKTKHSTYTKKMILN